MNGNIEEKTRDDTTKKQQLYKERRDFFASFYEKMALVIFAGVVIQEATKDDKTSVDWLVTIVGAAWVLFFMFIIYRLKQPSKK